MALDRIQRARHAEYKVHFVQRRREIYVYLGAVWVGRIIHSTNDPFHKGEGYGVFLQLPGLWGPVSRKDSLSDAKIEASYALRGWLEQLSGNPTEQEEREERAAPTPTPARVTRTRPTPAIPEAGRVRRTR